MMRQKLLIIDDDVAITRQLFWTLSDEFEVLTAHDLQSAIRRATVYEPDVTILDLHLPPTPGSTDTGLRVLEYVKGHLPASKVFVITADGAAGTQAECTRLGADGFLGKPLDVERLLSVVRRTTLEAQLSAA